MTNVLQQIRNNQELHTYLKSVFQSVIADGEAICNQTQCIYTEKVKLDTIFKGQLARIKFNTQDNPLEPMKLQWANTTVLINFPLSPGLMNADIKIQVDF